jgi:hypothetical protein
MDDDHKTIAMTVKYKLKVTDKFNSIRYIHIAGQRLKIYHIQKQTPIMGQGY